MERSWQYGVQPSSNLSQPLQPPSALLNPLKPSARTCLPHRCDTEESEEEVKRRSATKDAMGAKTLCIPLEQVGR